MQPHSNPMRVQGEKNVFCPYYGECLNHACKKGWEYWTCLDCEHRRKSEPVKVILLSPQNHDPYYSISPSLFRKKGGLFLEML
ncbi:MAG: hypothetical protein ABIK98_09455 [Pseudomonadota bacterium]|uniref:Uncharacterized protein n=1 Tax=Candidatus Desulfatibia profunda TaxID=2841695 RepID=A0A8J6NNW5_9BACT|nr:hypothetical protein [Candidatus Desulfatibia profunda]MBL7180390.1 hypothetical protein [Desulfobacterales bacterium]